MSNAPRFAARSPFRVYAVPALLGASTVVGLSSALLGDYLWDAVSWIALTMPLLPVLKAALEQRRPPPSIHPTERGVSTVDINPACQPLDLADNKYCGITLCPQCQIIHLRIGPISLKLPPHAFQAVCGAMQQAAEKLPEHLACDTAAIPSCRDTHH